MVYGSFCGQYTFRGPKQKCTGGVVGARRPGSSCIAPPRRHLEVACGSSTERLGLSLNTSLERQPKPRHASPIRSTTPRTSENIPCPLSVPPGTVYEARTKLRGPQGLVSNQTVRQTHQIHTHLHSCLEVWETPADLDNRSTEISGTPPWVV